MLKGIRHAASITYILTPSEAWLANLVLTQAVPQYETMKQVFDQTWCMPDLLNVDWCLTCMLQYMLRWKARTHTFPAMLLSNTNIKQEMHVHTCDDIQPDLVPAAVKDNGRPQSTSWVDCCASIVQTCKIGTSCADDTCF